MNWGAYHVKRAAGFVVLTLLAAPANAVADAREDIRNVAASIPQRPAELPDDPYLPYVPPDRQPPTAPAQAWQRDQFVSVQVNVDADGNNIIGDAANEPSIAVDPTDPNRMAIGWRQFDTINSNFRQAGVGFSQDRGQTWTFAGVLDPGQFRSDPVLASDADGLFHYNSLGPRNGVYICDDFISTDGGATWSDPVYAYGGDKAWMTIDTTDGPGRNNVYSNWNRSYSCCSGDFVRSVDRGQTYGDLLYLPGAPFWGTLSVGPDGDLYIVGNGFVIIKSTNAQDPAATPEFDDIAYADLGGFLVVGEGPNPEGLLGQAWIATDHSNGPNRGNVYLLASVRGANNDPADIMFARSTDGGFTWSQPIRINDDPPGNRVYQWFGTMSVSPNGRIDAIWNDNRIHCVTRLTEMYHSYSLDGGLTWSPNTPVTPMFDSHLGWPRQEKLGDYYDMISDHGGAHVAFAATFNGEQDVYYLRIPIDCNENGVFDETDITDGTSADCNGNGIPDECDTLAEYSADCNANVIPDECESDGDEDGIIDDCDNCPSLANAAQVDDDEDGIGDLCDPCPNDKWNDWDGDGVCTSDEECPADPYKLVPGQCGCGVPDTDDDGDGVANCHDRCPGIDDNVYAPECIGQIPTVSEWGMLVLALLLMTAGKIGFNRTPRID